MQKIKLLFFLLITLYSCKNKGGAVNTLEDIQEEAVVFDAEHNSRNSLDWTGDYSGILACADCMGIQTKLTLNEDNTYSKQQTYLGKGDNLVEEKGEFVWLENGSIIELNAIVKEKSLYKVEEDRLQKLDQNGNLIKGELAEYHILYKNNNSILNRYWKATEILGVTVQQEKELVKEPHLILKSNSTFSATGGCNSIFGLFSLKDKNFLSFGESPAVTEMACQSENFDQPLLKALSMTQQFIMKDENHLQLIVGKRAALAEFEALNLE